MILEHLHDLKPKPLMTTLAPKKDESRSYEMVACKFGNVPKGSVLSYQQKLSEKYVINDFSCPLYPTLLMKNKQPWNFTLIPRKSCAIRACSTFTI